MAEHTKFHLWLNTAIACVAIGIAGTSAFISWKSYSFNVESFGFNSSFTYDCPFATSFASTTESKSVQRQLGLCWQVTIANQSTSRVSILWSKAATSSEGHPSTLLFAQIQDRNGKQLPSSMSFDGGEARTVVVRVDVPITDALAKIIADSKSQMKHTETLADVASIAAEAKLDVLGNPVSVSQITGWSGYFIQFPPDYKKTIVTFRVHTGRENDFATDLIYPGAFASFLSSSIVH